MMIFLGQFASPGRVKLASQLPVTMKKSRRRRLAPLYHGQITDWLTDDDATTGRAV